MGANAPHFSTMPPTHIAKTVRESEPTDWVSLKCKYLTIASYHHVTPIDIMKYNEINPFLRERPKSFTISTKDLIPKIENQILINSHEKKNGIVPALKTENDIEKETVINHNHEQNGNLIRRLSLSKGKNGSVKSVRSKKSQRQPIKNLCCCWSVPKNNQLSDSGGPTDGQRVPDSNNVVAATESLSRRSSTRGSLRKVLPPLPNMDQQLSMSAKMIDRLTPTPKGNNSYGLYFLEYALTAEYNLLQTQKLGGLYVVPSANSPFIWFGVIFLRQGPYREGIFRFNLHIPKNYPDREVPSVIFESDVFHPLIDRETGELDVKRAFANKWAKNVNHLWHVLSYVRKVFYKIETNNPWNPEAAVLYANDNEMFAARVKECVEASKEKVYDPPKTDDPSAIIFSEYKPEIHDGYREELKKERNKIDTNSKEASSKGLSWVKPGTMQIFSKPAS